MSGRKVADRPDPEWVATLRRGDYVHIARRGALCGMGAVVRADDQHIVAAGVTFRTTTGFEKFPRMDGSRYLVPVASSPDKEGA